MSERNDERSGLGPRAIWAPWRLAYLETMGDDAPDGGATDVAEPEVVEPPAVSAPAVAPDVEREVKQPAGPQPSQPTSTAASFLAEYWASPQRDEQNHVLRRDEHGMILLNAFPYSNGHLLVALGEGRPRLLDYDAGQRAALWRLVDEAMALVERVLEPQGVNVGVNQGRAAGAGVPGHLHVHLVPRWSGDVNFISSVGQIRVVPSSLEQMAQRYRLAVAEQTGTC